MNDDVTPDSILQLGLGFWSSKALLSAVELGVFTELAKGPLDALTLIERLLSTPGPVGTPSEASSSITLAELRLRWEWDSLRSNPRFQKILAGPEPKTIY